MVAVRVVERVREAVAPSLFGAQSYSHRAAAALGVAASALIVLIDQKLDSGGGGGGDDEGIALPRGFLSLGPLFLRGIGCGCSGRCCCCCWWR